MSAGSTGDCGGLLLVSDEEGNGAGGPSGCQRPESGGHPFCPEEGVLPLDAAHHLPVLPEPRKITLN